MLRSNGNNPEKFTNILNNYFKINSLKNDKKLNLELSLRFLKKILIYIHLLMKFINKFFEYTLNKGTPESINRFVQLMNLSETKSPDFKEWCIKVPAELLTKDIETLIDMIDIEDIQTFLLLNHIFINNKNIRTKIDIIHKGKLYKFFMSSRMQNLVMCCKTKRKDELVKFSFKYIRKQVYKEFQEKNEKMFPGANKYTLKKEFNKRYVGENYKAIDYFESFDLSKEGLCTLKQLKNLNNLMMEFQKTRFIQILINEYIIEKQDLSLRNDLYLKEFLWEVLSRQHKNSMTTMSVLNSLDQFISFFSVNDNDNVNNGNENVKINL